MAQDLESSTTVQHKQSIYKFTWRIPNFDQICPEISPDFEIWSPPFNAGQINGKQLRWSVYLLAGKGGYLSNYLQLETTELECQSHGFQGVKCSFTQGLLDDTGTFAYSLDDRDRACNFIADTLDWGYRKFIKLERLYSMRRTVLADNVLTVCVELKIQTDPIMMTPPTSRNNDLLTNLKKRKLLTSSSIQVDHAVDNLEGGFHNLFQSQRFSDVEIICGQKSFHCHKAILAARSPVFFAMFDSQMSETEKSQVKIEGMSPSVILALFKFIYLNTLQLPSDDETTTWPDLIHAADKYDLPDMMRQSFDKMLENLSDQNVGQIALTVHTYGFDDNIKLAVRNYCRSRMGELMENKLFRDIFLQHPEAFYST